MDGEALRARKDDGCAGRWLAVAVVVHAIALLVAGRLHHAHHATVSTQLGAVTEVEIDMTQPEPLAPPKEATATTIPSTTTTTTTTTTITASTSAAAIAHSITHANANAGATADATSNTGASGDATANAATNTTAPGTEPKTAPDSDWSLRVTNGPPDLALRGKRSDKNANMPVHEAYRESLEPDAIATKNPDPGGLKAALAQHDFALGLNQGNVAASATRDAVSRSLVPDTSSALIEVRFDSRGHAIEAHVVDAANDRLSWDEAVRDVVHEIADRTVRVPEHANGLAVLVRVNVSLRRPSGASSAVTPGAGPGTLGLRGDLSDIRAPKSRNVAARVVGETAF